MQKSMGIDARIDELLANLEPITLDQMKEIRLMNRTDTKFVTNKETLARLLELAQGKYYAQFHCDAKIANYMTTYWDTDTYRFYMEHHNERTPRQKVRVRTYMDSNDTFLEVKTKNNHGRTKKKRVAVPGQEITGENGNEEFLQERVHLGLADIHPTVRNQFHRITLVNYGKTELTVFKAIEIIHRLQGTAQFYVIRETCGIFCFAKDLKHSKSLVFCENQVLNKFDETWEKFIFGSRKFHDSSPHAIYPKC